MPLSTRLLQLSHYPRLSTSLSRLGPKQIASESQNRDRVKPGVKSDITGTVYVLAIDDEKHLALGLAHEPAKAINTGGLEASLKLYLPKLNLQ